MIRRFWHSLEGRRTWFFLFAALALVGAEYAVDVLIGDGDGRLTQPLVLLLLNGIFYFLLACAVFCFSFEFEKTSGRISDWFGRFFSETMNPQFLGIFRISFAILALILLFTSHQLIGFINYAASTEELERLHLFFYFEIASLVLILFGIGGRIPYIFSFIYGSQYLHGDVGTHLFNMISFWSIFMGLDRGLAIRFTIPVKALDVLFNLRLPALKWPVILMALNLGYTVTTAGVSKAFDPVWLHHMGFYYTYLQPWLHGDTFDFIVDQKWLMVTMNWLTIISESIAFPLLLFRRTRLAGAICMVLMFMLLTYPFRIDAIGPFGLIMSLLVLAACTRFDNFRFRFLPSSEPISEEGKRSALLAVYGAFGFLLGTWIWLSVYYDVCREYAKGGFKYPRAEYPYYVQGRPAIPQYPKAPDLFRLPFLDRLSPAFIYDTGNKLTFYKVGPGWYAPFNFQHVIGRCYFRVIAVKDGKEQELIPVFSEQGNLNSTPFSGRVLQERAVSNRIWLFGLIGHKLASRFDRTVINPQQEKEALAFFRFFSEKYGELKGWEGCDIRLDIRFIDLPPRYEGLKKTWLQSPWTKLLYYSSAAGTMDIMEQPPRLDLRAYDFPYLRDGKIYFAPLTPYP
ncbi:MAG: hypothetical protein FD123_3541 [Bacteroidetes bacterium]|nr:MAG: hypothetical protein FD123_3541 [Bacteroidota bacterium]